MTYVTAFVLLAIEWPIAAIIGAAMSILTGLATWYRFRGKDAADTQKVIAEAEALRAKKEIDLSDAAMKLAQRLSDEVKEAKAELGKKEDLVGKLKEQVFQLEDQLRQERHKYNNLATQLELLKTEMEDEKKRHQHNLDILNVEISMLQKENQRIKKP